MLTGSASASARLSRHALLCAGLIGLGVSVALQFEPCRTAVIRAVTAAIGRSVDVGYWQAMLRLLSFAVASLAAVALASLNPRWRAAGRRFLTRLASPADAPTDAVTLRRLTGAGVVFFSVVLCVAADSTRLSLFNTDSWAYFELAKTVFSDDFYRFNTFRSYYSSPYSTSFPLGLPVLLSTLHLAIGKNPFAAVWLNVVVAVATWFLVVRIAARLRLSPLIGLALGSALLLWSGYLEEVLSGRSIPIALLLFLLASRVLLDGRMFLCGVFLGLSALVRFDYFAFALLFQVAALFVFHARGKRMARLPAGFLLGIAPWVLYSLTHFGRVWVSDSSWIALSAEPAYVVDFPAIAEHSAVQQPWVWAERIAGNIAPLIAAALSAAVTFPVVIALGALLLAHWERVEPRSRLRVAIAGLMLLASLGPYLLTGYSDKRYFSMLFVLSSFLCAFLVEPRLSGRSPPSGYVPLTLVSCAVSLAIGVGYLTKLIWFGWQERDAPDAAQQSIEFLARCSIRSAPAVYVFMGHDILAARFGALTGRPSALRPSNFSRMSPSEKQSYFDRMKPFIRIDNPLELHRCPSPP